jgi:hypothetical protein
MAKTQKVAFFVKDPDAARAIKDETARDDLIDNYSEDGEYFLIEVDLSTKTGRMLRRSEWKRYGR